MKTYENLMKIYENLMKTYEIHIDENGTGNASFELDEDGYYEEDFFNHDKDSQWYGHFHTFECNEDGADKAFDLLMESYLV